MSILIITREVTETDAKVYLHVREHKTEHVMTITAYTTYPQTTGSPDSEFDEYVLVLPLDKIELVNAN
jgi:hypothetical protein